MLRFFSFSLFLFLLLLISTTESYKILVFSPATSKSHLISNGRIADELARAGHDVTLLEIDFLRISETTKTAKIAKKRTIGGLVKGPDFKNVLMSFSTNVLGESSLYEGAGLFWAYQKVYNELCEELLERDELFQELKAENFDGFFAEQINLCGHGYGHALGIKHRFMISSCPFAPATYDFSGLPMPTSVVPMSTDMGIDPTYFERLQNFAVSTFQKFQFRLLNSQLTETFRQKFGKNFPNTMEIARESDIIFLASDEIIDFSAPTLQNIVHIGGLGIEEDTSGLDQTFAAEMEKGKNGVILFSLGTIANTSSIPKEALENFLKIVQKFPDYHFLIRADKYDKNVREKAKNVNNALVSDWLPQPAILNHPRLRTFITHAGYNGLVEAARAGVPLITIPFMFDQNLNSRAVESKGWGIRQVKQHLLTNPAAIEGAIREMITNPSYTRQAHRIRDLIRSKPQGARERFIKTTEWVMKNDGVHELLSVGRSTNFIIYYNLDIIIPIVFIPLYFIIPFLLGLYSYSCFGHLEQKKKSKKDKFE